MLRSTLPPGFRQASEASGLLVPEDTPREREVWTKDEQRLIDRATAFLAFKGLEFLIACADDRCKGQKLERVPAAEGSILRCLHKDRVLQRTN